MRGTDVQQRGLFSRALLQERVQADHPLRTVGGILDEALSSMSRDFDRVYDRVPRPLEPFLAFPEEIRAECPESCVSYWISLSRSERSRAPAHGLVVVRRIPLRLRKEWRRIARARNGEAYQRLARRSVAAADEPRSTVAEDVIAAAFIAPLLYDASRPITNSRTAASSMPGNPQVTVEIL
jgi:hypothetical protein